MATEHFVVDGSNLATEGRTEPSFAQLQEAVRAFRTEHPGAVVTVVVDASFEHRIDERERPAFAKAEAAGEVVSPPAGAVGRGDGFLLQIANRTGGAVVSNDSFQEFHAQYEWLFEPGRLIGGKPVPGVGWIFSLRRPVRGVVSRKAVQRAKHDAKASEQVQAAIAEATATAMAPDDGSPGRPRRGRRGGAGPPPGAVNEPAPFLQFVIDHRLGSDVEGTVESFASHGAFVRVDGVRCYIPLSAMGKPQSARAVLTRGETRRFVVQAVDAPRRGIELALPGFATVAATPTEETVAAEVRRPRGGAASWPAVKRSGAARTKAGKPTPGTKAGKPTPGTEAGKRTPGTEPAKTAKRGAKTEPARTAKRPAANEPAKPPRRPTKQASPAGRKPAKEPPPPPAPKGAKTTRERR